MDLIFVVLSTLEGDANLDGKVNAIDLNIIGSHWQQSVGGWMFRDLNGDEIVDAQDLNLHLRQASLKSVGKEFQAGFIHLEAFSRLACLNWSSLPWWNLHDSLESRDTRWHLSMWQSVERKCPC